MRALYRKSGSNGIINCDRLQFVLREAQRRSFPGITHYKVSETEMQQHSYANRSELQLRLRHKLPLKNSLQFKRSTFKLAGSPFKLPVKKPNVPEAASSKSCASWKFPQQLAHQIAVQCLKVNPDDGSVSDWDPIEKGWMAGFIDHVHTRSDRSSPPTILLHRGELTLHLVLTVLNDMSLVYAIMVVLSRAQTTLHSNWFMSWSPMSYTSTHHHR